MPLSPPSMYSLSCASFPSSTYFSVTGPPRRISRAGRRSPPASSRTTTSPCEMIASNECDSWPSRTLCSAGGNIAMMRSTVLRGAGGVDRGERLVAGVRRAERHPERLDISELADEDHVRVLSRGLAKRLIERDAVRAHLELRDQRAVVGVEVFDRILDRDDFDVVVRL